MLQLYRVIVVATLLVLLPAGFVGLKSVQAAAPGAAGLKNTIILGRVSNNPRKTYPRLERFAGFLANRLHALGVKRGGAVIAKSNAEMIQLLKAGKVDFLSETVMSALLFEEKARAEILLHEWKKNTGWYWSVLFTHNKSGINKLSHLRGKKIAFEDPGSTTGFLIPLAVLRRAGLNLVRLQSYRDTVPPDKVGYVFARKEINITAWVEQMNVHAGAYSNRDWLGQGRSPRSMRVNLALLHKSRPMLRSLFLARNGVRPKIKQAVKEILLSLDRNSAGRQVLKRYYKVKKYGLIKDGVKDSLDEARQLFSLVRDQFK